MSGEHVVSKNLFGKTVTVKGFHWCESEFKTIGINNLTAGCLCRAHNSALSECDEEAKRFREAVQWMMDKRFLPGDGPECVKHIDGLRLARWMARTACGILASGDKHVHVPPALARYALPRAPSYRGLDRHPPQPPADCVYR